MRTWLWYKLAVLAHDVQVKLDGFLDIALNLFQRLARGGASWEVRDVGAVIETGTFSITTAYCVIGGISPF